MLGLVAAALLGSAFGAAESWDAAQHRREAKLARLELERERHASGTAAHLEARIRAAQRRVLELDLQRAPAQHELERVRARIGEAEARLADMNARLAAERAAGP